jgi:flavin reductase (DIM6/NTAB) family NADH-FMN oxidoreductase RutF
MKIIESIEWKNWERSTRAHFINSLTGYKSVSLIGTVNKTGKSNLAIFSSLVHIGSNPALIGFINRPLTNTSHTLKNIRETEFYTINHIHQDFIEQAHDTSGKYPAEKNEFEEVGLKEMFIEGVKPPFVAESKVKYLLQFQKEIPIELNGTILVIEKLQKVLLEKEIIEADGFLKLHEAGSIASNGMDAYYNTTFIKRNPEVKL